MEDKFKLKIYDKRDNKLKSIFGYISSLEFTDLVSIQWANGTYEASIFLKDLIFVQCTGLKDKNGKLIREGDILFEDWKNEVYPKGKYWIVKWDDNYAGFYIEMINPSKFEKFKEWHLVRHDLDYEVIGNIYENPELLVKDGNNEQL